jgi:eukaryotic-like serine/threonine-protein kinase
MNPERWRVATGIFHAALERPPDQRPPFLAEACGQDPALRAEVDALLAGDERAGVAGDPLALDHAALPPGTMLGPYRVDALIDAGGMGEVYRAHDTRLQRVVAIKVLPAHSSSDNDARARFEREARAIASLSHPNICAIFDVGHEAGRDYLVMELLEGETLHQRLTRGALTMAALVDTALSLADALDSAHARGLIHRDLKPANIFLTTRGQPKILDFGLVKMIGVTGDMTLGDGGLTGPAAVIGTLAYMSPEQLRGESLDGRTDLFSLGLVLYEMATGQRAFTGSTSAVISAAILGQEPVPPCVLRGDLPVRLEEAILKLLEKDRFVRCQSAAELRADLMRVKRQTDAKSAPAPAPAGSSGASDPSPRLPARVTATAASPSSDTQILGGLIDRHRRGLAFGALTLAGLLGAFGYAWWRRAANTSLDSQAAPASVVIQPQTFTGNARGGVISPDGKFVAYVRSDDHGLYVRQTSMGSDVRIVAPEPGKNFRNLTVEPDSSYVDFVIVPTTAGAFPDLWRVPFLGGTPRKLATQVFSAVGWSPDARQMAFVRRVATENGVVSQVMIADADGSHERVLATRRRLQHFENSPAWSPDGSAIAVTGSTDARPDALALSEIVVLDLGTGAERQTIAEPGTMAGVVWLDGTRLLAVRDTSTSSNTQLMTVDLRRRTSTAVTRDLATYRGVSLTADRLTAVSTRTDTRAGVWLGGAAGEQMELAIPESAAAPTDVSVNDAGVMAYLASAPDSAAAIWTVRSSASTPQVVVGRGWPFLAAIVPQGDALVFAAEEPGGLYRISLDGTQLTKLTDIKPGMLRLTPNGETALFVARQAGVDGQSGLHTLWSVPVAGGTAREIFSGSGVSSIPSVSPDGRHLVFNTVTKERRLPIVCDLPDCTNPREQPFSMIEPIWTPDGRGFAYLNEDDPANIWIQPIDGGSPRPLTHFTDRRITSFAWSPDGKRLAASRATILSDLVLIKGFK